VEPVVESAVVQSDGTGSMAGVGHDLQQLLLGDGHRYSPGKKIPAEAGMVELVDNQGTYSIRVCSLGCLHRSWRPLTNALTASVINILFLPRMLLKVCFIILRTLFLVG